MTTADTLPPDADLIDCPVCDGAGELVECANDGRFGCSHQHDRSWKCARCNGTGEVPNDPPEYDPDAGYVATALVLFVCIAGSLLFLFLLMVGRQAMCETHANSLSYCPGFVDTHHSEQR